MELDRRGEELLEAAIQARAALELDISQAFDAALELTSEPIVVVSSIMNGIKRKWAAAAADFTEYFIDEIFHKQKGHSND